MGILTGHKVFAFRFTFPPSKDFIITVWQIRSAHTKTHVESPVLMLVRTRCDTGHFAPAYSNQLNFMQHDPGTKFCLRKSDDVTRGTCPRIMSLSGRQPFTWHLETKLWPRATFDSLKNIDTLSSLLAENLHITNLRVICTHTVMANLSLYYHIVYLIGIIFFSLPLRISGKLLVYQCFDSFE